jgi:hypothetical protein
MANRLPGNHLKHFHGLPPKEKRREKKESKSKKKGKSAVLS